MNMSAFWQYMLSLTAGWIWQWGAAAASRLVESWIQQAPALFPQALHEGFTASLPHYKGLQVLAAYVSLSDQLRTVLSFKANITSFTLITDLLFYVSLPSCAVFFYKQPQDMDSRAVD